jgi:hypothetical protein
MRMNLIIAFLLGASAAALAQTSPTQPAAVPSPQAAPPEASLADQARAAVKQKTQQHSKLVADNDSIAEQKESNPSGPFPDLEPLPNVDWATLNAAAKERAVPIVSKMTQFIASHPKDEAKLAISDWFRTQEQTIEDLKQRKDQLDGPAYVAPHSYDSSGRIYSSAAAVESSDRNTRDGMNQSLRNIEAQLSEIRDLGAKRGIPWSWMLPNQKDVRDKPLVF